MSELRDPPVRDLTPEEVARGMTEGTMLLVDVRELNETAVERYPDAVIVPLQCEFFALEGLSQLLKTIELVRTNLNAALEIQGIILTMFDKRKRLSDQVAADVRANMGEMVYNTVIPRNVRISEAPSHGLPALVYDLRCPGSQAYIKLAGEMVQRERSRLAA